MKYENAMGTNPMYGKADKYHHERKENAYALQDSHDRLLKALENVTDKLEAFKGVVFLSNADELALNQAHTSITQAKPLQVMRKEETHE